MNSKKILYIDMDNVLVDFASGIALLSDETKQAYEGNPDDVPGLFSLMEPMPGAIESVKILSEYFDLYILSTAPWKNTSAWSDKAAWVKKYFGEEKNDVFYKRLIITHRKDLNKGDYLIDDRTKNGAGEFEGELIRFGSERFPDWKAVTEHFKIRLQHVNCLLGGAIGDALGAPVEFMTTNEIRRQYGQEGIHDYVEHRDNFGEFTDDTQMTLFTADGLLRTYERQLLHGVTSLPAAVYHSYQNWLTTQTNTFDVRKTIDDEGWLMTRKELFRRRAPGNTCISALQSRKQYTVESPGNHSKGCGAIMRMAPVGLRFDPEQAFVIGCELGALTHGHPSGYLSAGFFASLISSLIRSSLSEITKPNRIKLHEAVETSVSILQKYGRHEETLSIVKKAVTMSETAECTPENIEKLGGGWVGEEALAISLYCALSYPDDFEKAVSAAVNHSGDSDSTGSITGNIMGLIAMDTIPPRWIDKLLYKDIVIQVAEDLHAQTNERVTDEDYEKWRNKYPGRYKSRERFRDEI